MDSLLFLMLMLPFAEPKSSLILAAVGMVSGALVGAFIKTRIAYLVAMGASCALFMFNLLVLTEPDVLNGIALLWIPYLCLMSALGTALAHHNYGFGKARKV
ncbi:hypothetical protein [Ferrimonas sp. YFM]|uniref:hypothetical protein n=1 Tax=Ferrimonas sp. YFM TaxID=3028878 RepID=UPI002574792F|nr:hypothetical protein [Ferrimonas sp. YFM]BDY04895.1 hypothetical protein F0521_19360 [Ferrimonas sp. YFM]